MLVRDMLAEPLGLRLLGEATAALERPVARICVTDMPDPTPFVTPGALVCTGLVWRRDADDSDRYVGLLARAGAVAVAAGVSLHGRVPPDVVAACARHGLPLLEVPERIPFSRMIEYLAGRSADMRLRRAKSGMARQRRLLSAVADGRDIAALIDEFARDCGISVWLLTATGMPVAGTEPLSDDRIDALVAAAATASRLPLSLPGGYAVWPVGGRFGYRISVWYLVIRGATDEQDPDEPGADLAAIAELYRMRHLELLRMTWERDRSPVDAASGPMVAVAFDPVTKPEQWPDGGPGRDALRAIVHDVLPGATTEVDADGRIIAWVRGTEQDVAAQLRRRLIRLAPALREIRLRVGVSACRGGESATGTAASAIAAASVAADEPVDVRVADVDSAVGLFTTIPDQLQRRFADRVLGPLVDYDERTGAELLQTLEVFLGCAGSWRQAADRMHLHLNTVRYRIGRVEELTGRDLGRLDDRLDLYLAVRARSRPGALPA